MFRFPLEIEAMELNGALSNPRAVLELWKLSALFVSVLTRDPRKRDPAQVDPRCGEITDTVEKMLTETGAALHVSEIKHAVERRLAREISLATIEDLLHKHARTGRILKVRRGIYASPSSGHYSCPPIVETVVDVLGRTGRPMKLKAIHAECETMLGGPVSYQAVKSTVCRYRNRIVRVAYGWYTVRTPLATEGPWRH